jgi:hypothetical protein
MKEMSIYPTKLQKIDFRTQKEAFGLPFLKAVSLNRKKFLILLKLSGSYNHLKP